MFIGVLASYMCVSRGRVHTGQVLNEISITWAVTSWK
jgi:hypothetical protein